MFCFLKAICRRSNFSRSGAGMRSLVAILDPPIDLRNIARGKRLGNVFLTKSGNDFLRFLRKEVDFPYDIGKLSLFRYSRDGSRTHTEGILSPLPLPLGYPAVCPASLAE